MASTSKAAHHSCCVPGCSYNRLRNPELRFYGFPGRAWEKERKELWIKAVNRVDSTGKRWLPTKHSVVCSTHFAKGRKTEEQYDPSYIPTIFLDRQDEPSDPDLLEWMEKVRAFGNINNPKGNGEEMDLTEKVICVNEPPASISCQTDPWPDEPTSEPSILFCWRDGVDASTQTSINLPREKTDQGAQTQEPNAKVDKVCGTDEELVFGFLGFPSIKSDTTMNQLAGVSLQFFHALLSLIVLHENGQPAFYKKVIKENRLLIFLMKMKLGISFCALGCLFGVSDRTASTIFQQMLQTLTEKTRAWLFWPSKQNVPEDMPATSYKYKNGRCIVDCTEIRTDRPLTCEQKAFMYSNYEGGFTLKYLIAVTPDGFVRQVSKGYGGRATDSHVTNDSGFRRFIEPGDVVLADKPFLPINSAKRNRTQIFTPLAYNQQFTAAEVGESYKVAPVRFHVERAIQRIKILRILDHFTVEQLAYTDAIMHMACVIANSLPPLRVYLPKSWLPSALE